MNEAALLAGRLNKVVVERVDFIQAVERSIAVSLFTSHKYALMAEQQYAPLLFFALYVTLSP